MFADISGFVALARRLGANQTVELLNRIVSQFDALAEQHGVEKIKTIGDAYMVVSGVPEPVPDHTARLGRMAFDMLDCIARMRTETGLNINIRVGMASGPVTAGVIGTKKFSYDVWGDPVNLASRLEGLSVPGRVLVCPSCHAKLGEAFEFEITRARRHQGPRLAGDLVPRRRPPRDRSHHGRRARHTVGPPSNPNRFLMLANSLSRTSR